MNRLALAAVTVASLAVSLPAAAQFQKPEDAVKYRQSAMFVKANHFGRIGAMVQGRVPFDAAQAAANAEVVATMSRLPFVGFVEGTSSTNKGGASAKIWSDRAKFDDGAKKMQEDSSVRLKVEQNQLVSDDGWIGSGAIGLQGA